MFSDPATNIAKLGINEGMKVADFGAGSGFYSLEAAKLVGHSGLVYALDVQKALLERIRAMGQARKLHNIEVIWADVEKIGGTKLRDASVDRVIASNILFQINHKDDFALEVKRILKPGGKIMLIDWNDVSQIGPKSLVLAKDASTLFEKNAFVLDQSFSAGSHHYGLVFTKK